MLLSKYIEGLQKFLNSEGDMECYYASDDEGNDYIHVSFNGSLRYTYDDKAYRAETIDEEEIEEDDKFIRKICVIN